MVTPGNAWEMGFLAATEFCTLSDNPFVPFHSNWSEWNRGWMDGNRFVAETEEFFK